MLLSNRWARCGFFALLAVFGVIGGLPDPWLPIAQGTASEVSRVIHVAPEGDDASGGTEDSPLRTIAAAAAIARAGDTVRIGPGTYDEMVRIAGEGTRERPIVFEAGVPGAVIMSGEHAGFAPLDWAGDHDSLMESGNRWVTLQGITFRDIGDQPAVRASTGWRLERCVFERVGFGVNIRGHEVVVADSIFQDINSPDAHAVVAYGGRNLRLTGLVIRRVNTMRLVESITRSAVFKILNTENLLIERVVSEDNVGPGLWLDTANRGFVIRRNYVSGNRGDRHDWEGAGLWIENNPSADAEIYENTITDNSGAGIEIMESSDIVVRDNTFLGNASCIGLRNLDRGPDPDGLRDISIHHNLCGDWQGAGIATGIGSWDDWDAESRHVVIDDGLYLTRPGAVIFHWLGENAVTLREASSRFGFETNGAAAGSVSAPLER